jgi:hypothetical protein
MFFGGYFQSFKLDQNLRKKFQQSIYGSGQNFANKKENTDLSTDEN